jgi:hypothetical protein
VCLAERRCRPASLIRPFNVDQACAELVSTTVDRVEFIRACHRGKFDRGGQIGLYPEWVSQPALFSTFVRSAESSFDLAQLVAPRPESHTGAFCLGGWQVVFTFCQVDSRALRPPCVWASEQECNNAPAPRLYCAAARDCRVVLHCMRTCTACVLVEPWPRLEVQGGGGGGGGGEIGPSRILELERTLERALRPLFRDHFICS